LHNESRPQPPDHAEWPGQPKNGLRLLHGEPAHLGPELLRYLDGIGRILCSERHCNACRNEDVSMTCV